MKRWPWLLCLLFLILPTAPAAPATPVDVGFFSRALCSSLNPVQNQTWCFQQSDGALYVYNGSWIAVPTGTLPFPVAINVRDYGAKGDGVTDDSTAINAAITAASKANSQTGSPARTQVFFPPGVYLCKHTLIFKPFINYVGVRSATVNGADWVTFRDSHGSIIRAHTDIYDTDHKSGGVLVYIAEGDMQIENLTFVGTGQFNANPSVGIQFGSSGGTRTHEGADSNVAGINLYNTSMFVFRNAWEVNNLNDAYGFNSRFESNVTSIALVGRSTGAYIGTLELYGAVIYASPFGVNIGDHANMDFHMVGGLFEGGELGGATHLVKNGGRLPQTVATYSPSYRFTGTKFRFAPTTASRHVLIGTTWDGFEGYFQFDGCTFENGIAGSGLYFARNAGTAKANAVYFNNPHLKATTINLSAASDIKINGGVFENSSITATSTVDLSVRGATFKGASGSAVTAIAATGASNGLWSIIGNDFDSTIKTPVSIAADLTNNTIITENNRGLHAYTILRSGTTTIETRGTSNKFITNNGGATVLGAITPAWDGQTVYIHIGDSHTTIDFTRTKLKGHGGANWVPTPGDSMICTYVGAADMWDCRISDNTP